MIFDIKLWAVNLQTFIFKKLFARGDNFLIRLKSRLVKMNKFGMMINNVRESQDKIEVTSVSLY